MICISPAATNRAFPWKMLTIGLGHIIMIKTKQTDYDAIVIGSGISGGYAAMELCEKGYKTLVLERGPSVEHGEYPTAHSDTWDLPYQDMVPQEEIAKHYEKQNRLSWWVRQDRKSTRLNSSHVAISYAVFC